MAGRSMISAAKLAMLSLAAPATALFVRSNAAVARDAHPVTNVIDMLKTLSTTVESEAKAETLTYEKFTHWCGRSAKALSESIAAGETSLEEIRENIAATVATIDRLIEEISNLAIQLSDFEAAGTRADGLRADELAIATAEMQALTTTIQAVKDALAEMEGAHTRTEASALLQQRLGAVLALADAHMSDSQRSLLQTVSDPADINDAMYNPAPGTINANGTNRAPPTTARPVLKATGEHADHVDVYDFKSHKVIELLKGLQIQFEDDFTQREKEETASVNAYTLEKEARQDLIDAATASKLVKEGEKTTEGAKLTTLQGEETNTQNDLDADKGTLSTTEQTCNQRATEWAERSKVRDDEREAIGAAIEILAKVTGVRHEQPENPVLPASPVVFLQLNLPSNIQKAVKLLREEARVTHSAAITAIANAVAAKDPIGSGHFDQVINSIEKMIFHLMKEQKEEDVHKNWCDKELEKTSLNIDDKASKIGELTGKINVATTRAGTLGNEITAANTMIKDIVEHMADAAEIRKEGKRENKLAVDDAEAAQTAISQAVSVLKDFYKSSGGMTKEAWEFVQAPVTLPADPALWSAPYTGVADPIAQGGSSDGIVTVLEALGAHFASMESNTLSAEEMDQTAYADDVKECEIEKARRTKEAEVKDQEKQRLVAEATEMEASRKAVIKEKEAGEQYQADLQPACVTGSDNGMTYEDRKADRAKEVKALGQAQGYLKDAFENITAADA